MKDLKPVPPEDFDVKLQKWKQLSREGKLFYEETVETFDSETVKENVRAYVRRIDSFVTPPFRASIDTLWEAVFCCDELMALLMPKPKARKCRHFDKYGVMRLIGVLRENDVYEQYSDRKFMALLEQTDKDCPYRKYLSAGIGQRALIIKIRQIAVNNKY